MSEEMSPAMPNIFTSPLRAIMVEMHEVYQELRSVGFDERASAGILGNMVLDIMMYRSESQDEEYDDDDEEEESDTNDNRGPE